METESGKNNSKLIIALVLMIAGSIMLLRKLGLYFHFPVIQMQHIFYPLGELIHNWSNIILSWQMVCILVGFILLAGKRTFGLVLIIFGGIFLLPKLFFFAGLTLSVVAPLFLIIIGIALITRIIR